ncbi:MAG: TonB-dependent receptor [Bryobacteraceae bacterium]
MLRCQIARFLATFTGALMYLFLYLVPAYPDVTARISGTVTDPSGALIPDASVTAINTQTGIKQRTRTDAQGYYSFPSLPVGRYDLLIQTSGFKDYKETDLILDVNSALTANARLQVGEANQEVTVNAAAVQVETTNTQMGEVITGSKMTTVPLNGRSYTDLLALQPGVAPVSSGQYSATPVSGDLNPGSLSVSGQRESANGFMVNGGNVNEGVNMGTAIVPNLDSIAEFRILTNNFDAEYGNYAGGLVNAITKSGTNEFHGDVFDFLRNTDLDARNFFSPTIGKFIQNQFGGTFGGPILKDKLFFFGDYQGTRQILGQSTGNVLVPSLADRQGNVADMSSLLTGTVTGAYWANQLAQKLGYPVTPGESYYTPGCATNTACVFPNAVIPQSAMSPVAQNLLKYIPTPNSGNFYSTSAYNQTLNDDKGSFRMDSNSRIGMVSAYYFIDDYTLTSPYATASLPGFDSQTDGRAHMLTVSDTKVISPTVVNELRAQFMRSVYISGLPIGGLGVSLSSLGFVTGPETLGINVLNPAIEGVPSLIFNNYSIGVSVAPTHQFNNTYQLIDNFSVVRGNHTMKFGGSGHYDQITQKEQGYNNGQFNFTGTETGSDYVDFLLGAPSTYLQGVQLPLHTRTKYVGLYGQDSWRIEPNLTLNYGLRWEVTSPWYEVNNQLETIVPGLQSQVFPGAPTGWVFPGDPGIPRTLAPVRHNNFAPRIGLAYSPDWSSGLLGKLTGGPGKTSIRAAFGMFYTAFEDATGFNEVGDAPFGFFYVSPEPPLLATPFVDRGTGNPEGQRFPVIFPPPGVSAKNPDNSVNWAQFLPISSSPGFYYRNRVPYAEDYSLSIQRQIGNNNVLSLSYVGTQGHALLSDLEANVGNPALCLSANQPSQVAPGSATCGPFGENGVYTLANGQVINGTRYPLGNSFGSNGYFITMGNSNYNSLQATLRHRSGPLELLVGYTWSKSIDDSSGWGDQINPLNYRLSRSLSAFDVPQDIVISYHYELPFARLFKPNRLTSGWIISGVTRFASGLPIFLTETDDRSLLGTSFTGPNGNEVDTPNYTPGNLDFKNPRSGQPYFNTSLFSPEPLGQLGTANKRFFHGPGIDNWDMALLKDINLAESKIIQLRFEFFNVFNHAQFMNPSGNINNGTFGYVTQARDPRIGQVALKFLF